MFSIESYLNEQTTKKLWAWLKQHDCKLPKNPNGSFRVGAIDGRFTYSFTPTSLGVVIKVKCACGQEIDVTPYEDW